MAASLHERLLARVMAVLLAAGTDAGSRITRGRVDAQAPDELPAINVRRAPGQLDAHGNGVDRATPEFELDLYVQGDDWETLADALHMQAHAALFADPDLAALVRGLRCIRTNPQAESGDRITGLLTATYQAQALVRIPELTKAVS